MSECVTCGCEVNPKRVEILEKLGKKITCLEHSTEQRVAGFTVIEGKSERSIQIVDQTQYTRLSKLQRKGHMATGGPAPPVFGRPQGKVVYKPKDPENPKP
jgi:hypothetical protein